MDERAKSSFKLGEIYSAPWQDFRPTQFCVGQKEVELKKEEFLEKLKNLKNREVTKLIAENELSVVLGPGKAFYCIDGHHKLRMIAELAMAKKMDNNEAYFEIKEDLSKLDMASFARAMQEENFLFLYDNKGQKQSFGDLPRNIMDLQDDPFRSIAWIVRRLGAYKDLEIPMQEFSFANLFRQYIKTAPTNNAEYIVAIHQAISLLLSRPEAQKLKGALDPEKVLQCKSLFAVPVLSGLLKFPQ